MKPVSIMVIRRTMHRGKVVCFRVLTITAVTILLLYLWRRSSHRGGTTISAQKMSLRFNSFRPFHTVNRLSPSVSIEIGIFSDGWIKYLRNPKFLTLVKALGPSYLRVGGTRSDHSHFINDEDSTTQTSTLAHKSVKPGGGDPDCRGKMPNAQEFEQHLRLVDISVKHHNAIRGTSKFNELNITYTASQFDEFMTFVFCTDLKVVFGLNLLDRVGHKWNPANVLEILSYAKSKGYRIDWELGNEPNSFKRNAEIVLSPEDLAGDFVKMRNILRNDEWWRKSKLLGPDTSQTHKEKNIEALKKFLRIAGESIDATTFHQYYIKSANATVKNFTDNVILDSLKAMVDRVVTAVKKVRNQLPVWVGETGSSSGGGADGLSNTYAAGFMWLDKLGVCASHGIDVVFRQTLLGGNYAMIDNNFNPNPDYWLTLLYKILVGEKVMRTAVASILKNEKYHNNRKFRVYAHCTNTERTSYEEGSVTLYYLNLLSSEIILEIEPAPSRETPTTAMAYILTPPRGILTSREVNLNRRRLQMTDIDKIQPLRPEQIDLLRDKIVLPGKSFGFIVLPGIAALACL